MIILRVTPSQLAHCRDTDPMTIWNNLITIHSSRGRSTIIALRRRFHRLRLEQTETMSAYVARVRHIAFLLEEADVTVTDDDIILAITSGLPRSYDSFLISLDATSDDDYTLAHVIARLVNEHQRQRGHHHQSTTDSTDVAYAASNTPHLAHITCFNCGKKGHYQANCPNTRSTPSTPTTTVTNKSSKDDQATLADEVNEAW
jgi:gag-polypeptide of LTR copia-type/Zinc knuckle